MFVRRALVLLLLACAVSAPWWPRAAGSPANPTSIKDAGVFRLIVHAVDSGEGYYEAASRTMHAHGYPTRSVFNWRQPTLYMALGWLGVRTAQLLLALAIVIVVIRAQRQLSAAAAVMLVNACLFVVTGTALYFTEFWAGVCVTFSLLASMRGRPGLAVSWAVVALSIRELAAPYCVAMTLLAASDRRWREVRLWLIGGLAYAPVFFIHLWSTRLAQPEGALSHSLSWVYFGGLSFVIDTLAFHGVIGLLPRASRGIVLGAFVLAAFAPSMPKALRVTGLAYLAFFSLVGQPFNAYWGAISAPLLACWLPFVLEGARAAWRGPVHLAPPPVM